MRRCSAAPSASAGSERSRRRSRCLQRGARAALAASVLLWATVLRPSSAQEAPLPAAEPFYAAVRENLVRAQREQYKFAYKERRTEVHRNPFGRIGTGEVRVYEVIPGPSSTFFDRRLLERDGVRVENSRVERQERRRPAGREAVDDALGMLALVLERRERVNGRDAIVVRFHPKPGASPRTREGRLARAFSGVVWVDEAAREVMRVEAVTADDISYGLGLIARLNEGATVTVTRTPVEPDLWLPASIRMVGDGRALLFRRMKIDYFVEWFDYRRMRE